MWGSGDRRTRPCSSLGRSLAVSEFRVVAPTSAAGQMSIENRRRQRAVQWWRDQAGMSRADS
eukprot:4629645-Amphidinium_carterae.1